METGLNEDYSKFCRNGEGLYYQSPNLYYSIPLNCLSIPYERLLTDCLEIQNNLQALVDETCPTSIESVCSQVYELNPPYSCVLEIYNGPLTALSLTISNSLAGFGIFSLFMGLFMKKWFKDHKPHPHDVELLAASKEIEFEELARDLTFAVLGKSRNKAVLNNPGSDRDCEECELPESKATLDTENQNGYEEEGELPILEVRDETLVQLEKSCNEIAWLFPYSNIGSTVATLEQNLVRRLRVLEMEQEHTQKLLAKERKEIAERLTQLELRLGGGKSF
jgi:hypothetical protein